MKVGKKPVNRYAPRPHTIRDEIRKIYKDNDILEALPPIRNTPTRLERVLAARGLSQSLSNVMTEDEATELIAATSGLIPGRTSATEPERLTFAWLKNHGFQYGGEGPSANTSADFAFQYPLLGGKQSKSGSQADLFLFPRAAKNMKGTAIRVQGTYWHTQNAIATRDEAERLLLTANGYEVRDLWDYETTAPGILDAKMREFTKT